jgi:riboflavin kinase / FMN adenylyltransferase
MMQILHTIEELAEVPGPVVLAIGVFDGVHLGHRAVIERALADSRRICGTAVAITFDPHPMRVLCPDKAPRLLTSTPHKIRLLRDLALPNLLIIPFTREFAATPPQDFIYSLNTACKPLREICVGHQWSFGKNRAGNLELLDRLGDELGFQEVGVPAVEVDGQIVSSTLIRRAVETGDLQNAARLLGREYTILGTVVEGDHLGKQLGFPTANLSAHNEQFPPNGVYVVEALHEGWAYGGVVNIGTRPTIHGKDGERILELHLFDFTSDIYGDDVEVFFRRYLREEKQFPSLDELRMQIARDVREAQEILHSIGRTGKKQYST